MLDVTQSWTERLQHVVVPIAAQQIKGRTSCERMERVRCVAGQQMAMCRRGGGAFEAGGMLRVDLMHEGGVGRERHTLEREEADEGRPWRVVDSPSFQ